METIHKKATYRERERQKTHIYIPVEREERRISCFIFFNHYFWDLEGNNKKKQQESFREAVNDLGKSTSHNVMNDDAVRKHIGDMMADVLKDDSFQNEGEEVLKKKDKVCVHRTVSKC